jgi:hypothetical protein
MRERWLVASLSLCYGCASSIVRRAQPRIPRPGRGGKLAPKAHVTGRYIDSVDERVLPSLLSLLALREVHSHAIGRTYKTHTRERASN